MTQTNITTWLTTTVGEDTLNAVAVRSGVSGATLHRQSKSGDFSPETVVSIARAYEVSVIDALIAQGLIDATDVATTYALDALMDATDKQLVDEIARRLEMADASGETTVFDDEAPVVDLDTRRDRPFAAHDSDLGGQIDPDTE